MIDPIQSRAQLVEEKVTVTTLRSIILMAPSSNPEDISIYMFIHLVARVR
jgi:hypothetical protein